MEEQEHLLAEWDNRPSVFWEPDSTARLKNEIRLLEVLQKCGGKVTRDGRSISSQLEERRQMLNRL